MALFDRKRWSLEYALVVYEQPMMFTTDCQAFLSLLATLLQFSFTYPYKNSYRQESHTIAAMELSTYGACPLAGLLLCANGLPAIAKNSWDKLSILETELGLAFLIYKLRRLIGRRVL